MYSIETRKLYMVHYAYMYVDRQSNICTVLYNVDMHTILLYKIYVHK